MESDSDVFDPEPGRRPATGTPPGTPPEHGDGPLTGAASSPGHAMARASRVRAAAAAWAIVAFLLVWLANTSPWLPAPHLDALSFVGAAESLVHGRPFEIPIGEWNAPQPTSPLAHFPPGFALALAVPRALGVPPRASVVFVLALAAALSAAVVVRIVGGASGPAWAALAATALLFTPALAQLHVSMWSEPLFFALMLLMLDTMVRTPGRPLRYGIFAALATFTRYAGAGFIVAAGIWAAAHRRGRGERVRAAAAAWLPGFALMGAWSVYTSLRGGSIRTVGLYGGLGETARGALRSLREWLAPGMGGASAVVVTALLLVCGVAVLVAAGRVAGGPGNAGESERRPRQRRLLYAAGLLALAYTATVAAARMLADPLIPLDTRILAPVFVLATVAVVGAVAMLWRRWTVPLRAGALVLVWIWVSLSAVQTVRGIRLVRRDGFLYTAPIWRYSDALRWVRREGQRRALYSNEPELLYFLAGRPAYRLPPTLDPETLARFSGILSSRPSAVVLVPLGMPDAYSIDELVVWLRLRPVLYSPGGAVFLPPTGPPTDRSR